MLKSLKKKDVVNPRGKVLAAFEDEWYGQFAVTKDGEKFYLGKSDANWMYKDLRVRDNMFRAPWALTEEEMHAILDALKKAGAIK